MDKLTEEQRTQILAIHKTRTSNINALLDEKIGGVVLNNKLKQMDYEYTCSMNLILNIPPPSPI